MEAAGQPEAAGRGTSYSGRVLLRMPEELHAELARASESEGVSMNAFITAALANAVGWRRGTRPRGGRRARTTSTPPAPAAKAPRPRRRLVERLLVANLVVVAVVGGLAIALLVQTLR
jgi:hypothetical protein